MDLISTHDIAPSHADSIKRTESDMEGFSTCKQERSTSLQNTTSTQ